LTLSLLIFENHTEPPPQPIDYTV